MMARLLVALMLVGWALGGAQAAVPAERTLFSEPFDDLQTEGCPPGWLPLQGEWFLAQRASRVLRQGNQDLTRDSWILAAWQSYSVVTKFRTEGLEAPGQAGVLAYADAEGRAYRLRAAEDKLYLDKLTGDGVVTLGQADAKLPGGKWYSLRLTVLSTPGAATLSARAWAGDADEPKEVALKVKDDKSPLPGGSVGLWTGGGAARFAHVAVRRYEPTADKPGEVIYATDFNEVDQGHVPPFWKCQGGHWLRDLDDKQAGVLRQVTGGPGPDYDDNASALLNWTGYTVSARAIAHPGPGKWGLGLVAYYGAQDSNYRLRLLDNRLYLVKQLPTGRIMNLATVTFDARRGRWYNLKFAVENLRGVAQLTGKVWADEEPEPETWAIRAYDRDQPLTGGAPGLWSFGGAADFDNFLVRTTTLSSLNATLAGQH